MNNPRASVRPDPPLLTKYVGLQEVFLLVLEYVLHSLKSLHSLHKEKMFLVRQYVDADLDAVVALWYRSWTKAFPNLKHPQPFEGWKSRFQNELLKRGNAWIAEHQGRIVGFIVVMESEGVLTQIFANVDVQRMGVGTTLINQAKAICPNSLLLTTLQQNEQARRFYEKKRET